MNPDRVPIAPLKQRYGHRKFYAEYIPALGIEIQKDGRNGYISAEEAKILEQYHQARGMGETAKQEFLNSIKQSAIYEEEIGEIAPIQRANTLVHRHVPERIGTIDLANAIGEFEGSSPVRKWLIASTIFTQAAINRLVIPCPVLLILLGVEKLPRCHKGSFNYLGFEFRPVARNRREWRVYLIQYE